MTSLNNIPVNSNWNDIASKLNSNFTTLNQEVTSIANSMSVCKGIFENYSLLSQTVPHPLIGQYAYVVDYTEVSGTPGTYEVSGFTQYICIQEGEWTTGAYVESLGEDINLTGYVTAEVFNAQIATINANITALQTSTSSSISALTTTSNAHTQSINDLKRLVEGVPATQDSAEVERTVAYKSDVEAIQTSQTTTENEIDDIQAALRKSAVNLRNLSQEVGGVQVSNYDFKDINNISTVLNNVTSWEGLKTRINELLSVANANSNVTWVMYGSINQIGYVVVMMPASSNKIYCITAATVGTMNGDNNESGLDLGIKKLIYSGTSAGYVWHNLVQVVSESDYENLATPDPSLIYFTTE